MHFFWGSNCLLMWTFWLQIPSTMRTVVASTYFATYSWVKIVASKVSLYSIYSATFNLIKIIASKFFLSIQFVIG